MRLLKIKLDYFRLNDFPNAFEKKEIEHLKQM